MILILCSCVFLLLGFGFFFFFLSIAFLQWRTVGLLRSEGTLGGHLVQDPSPSRVGCEVRLGSLRL